MVHQYVSTGKVGSKFGLDAIALNHVLHILSSDECPVHVVGLHCHLGSTITNSDVLRYIFCNIYCPSGFLQGETTLSQQCQASHEQKLHCKNFCS